MSNENDGSSDELDPEGQLALFADVSAVSDPVVGVDPEARNGSSDGELEAGASVTSAVGVPSHADADPAVLRALEETLVAARVAGDGRAPLEVLASSLANLVVPPSAAPADRISLRQARDDWLRRLEALRKSESSVVAYRVAIDDLLDWSEPRRRSVFEEATIVDYLSAYQQRAEPAPAPYYRRFLLLRRFLGWVCRRIGAPNPVSRPRPAAEATAGARLADTRGVPSTVRRCREAGAEPARPRRA